MNPLSVLRDSLYFFRRHLISIAGLCLPLVIIEAICSQLLYTQLGEDASPAYGLLVGLLFWSWIWGIPGALLAAPVTVALVVLGAHVPILRPWALLLSDRTDMEGLTEATRPK